MSKKRKKYFIVAAIIVILLLVPVVLFLMRYHETGIGEGYIVVEDRYTGIKYGIYDDHACIRDYSGSGDLKLPEEIFGRKITEIGSSSFMKSDVRTVIIPDTVENIIGIAFDDCENLEEIVFGKGVKSIDASIRECPKLHTVVLNEGLESIGQNCFSELPALKSIVIPSTVKEIGNGCFCNGGLERIEFKGDVNRIDIGRREFFNSEMAAREKYVIFGDGILFACGYDSGEIVIPRDVKTINGAFGKYWFHSGDIYIPESVVTIRQAAFWPKESTNVYIPETVTEFIEKDDECVFGEYVTVITTEGSPAEAYAKANGIKYEIVDDVQSLYDAALERQKAGQE